MPSLAEQLAKNASLNANLFVDRSKRKPTVSYLFTGRDADQYDLETIFALGQNAFIQLCSVEPALEVYEETLFSDQAKGTDRTLLNPDATKELDRSIEGFLALLGPYVMDAPTGKVIEWLVRRFRIYEFNIDATMALFLPYHETPHFTKMVSILKIKPNNNALWSFLTPYKSAAQNIQRVSLVSEMLRNSDLARFVTALLPNALREQQQQQVNPGGKGAGKGRGGVYVHRTLLAFNAATVNEFIKRSKKLDEGTGVMLVSALLEPLQSQKGEEVISKDAILGSYICLAALSQKCDLAPTVMKTIVGAMAGAAAHVSTEQFVNAIVGVCQNQEALDKLSQSTVKAILHLPGIKEEITAACRWYGIEKLLVPVISRLVPKLSETEASDFVENLIVTASAPDTVLVHLTRLLAKAILSAEMSLKERQLLSMLYQRHPAIVQRITEEIVAEDEDNKDAVEELVMSLSTTQNISSVNQNAPSFDLIISSTHADSNVRAIAVRKLVSSLAEAAVDSEEFTSIRGALLGRVHDPSIEVLELLYEKPEVLAKAFSSKPSEYIEALEASVAAPGAKTKRAVVRLHLGFLIGYLFQLLDASNQETVFERLLLPFLLFSKPRQHTAEVVWEAVEQAMKVSPDAPAFEPLKGCPELVKKDGQIESLVAVNSAIASKIADNVLHSDRFAKHQDTLIAALQGENPLSRAFSYLIMRSLLEKMSGSHQIEAASKVFDALRLEQLPTVDDLAEDQDLLEVVDSETIGRFVVTKPSSKTTLAWLQVGLVSSISRVPQPPNRQIDWLKDPDSMSRASEDLYVCGTRKVYKMLNNSGTVPVLALGLLQSLFSVLETDVLAFLAGVWTSSSSEFSSLQTLALLQGTAFLEAHVQEADGIDFQTILPAILVALQFSNPMSRLAALEGVKRLRVISESRLTQVYKFDVIYGKDSQDLQYLDQSDLQRYLDALLAHKDHFENDGSYLPVFHSHHLTKATGDKKKDSEYKKRVLCYLLSHINALSSADMQTILLKTVGPVIDKAKLQLLLPTIQALLLPNQPQHEELLLELLRSFDGSAAKELNDPGKPFWNVYLDLLRHCLQPGASDAARNVIAQLLEKSLYSKLDASRQVELCHTLLELCSEHPSLQRFCKQLLTDVLNEVPVIVKLLDDYSPSSSASERASKRARTSEASEHGSIRHLSFLVEILGTKSLPGSIELISHLLQVLSNIVQNLSPTEAEVNYTEQLLMSAVESAASQVSDIPNLSPTAIRVDVLVDLIRITENPATFHQALLLMSKLTRLAPESVLHNVMPVFTFMGSNVFHRDDSYSFSVVQKTIDGIVPVMVSSLKKTDTEPLQLWINSKEFLHVFTDAVNHIPRHRRSKFFNHLVDVLGTKDFLSPVSMLLVEKVANRVARQSGKDAYSTLELPTTLLNNAPLPVRIQSLVDILGEAQRLINRLVQPGDQGPVFLLPSNDADPSTSSSLFKRRAQSLIAFVGSTFNSPLPKSATQSAHPERVAKGLVALSTLDLPEGHQDITSTALTALNRLLSVLSALDFIQAVSSMMEIDDERIQAGALELLGKRLSDVSTSARQEASPSIVRILANIKVILSKKQSESLGLAALRALSNIASTMESAEQGALTELVPVLISILEKDGQQTEAWEALLPLSRKLGPRIIPYFRIVVQLSVKTLAQESNGECKPPSSDHASLKPIVPDVIYSTLQALLGSIPTFWASPEVLSVLSLYIDGQATGSASSMVSLVKALTKRVSSKILLPSILELWTKLQTTSNARQLATFFEVVSRTLRSADRPIILESLRSIFKMFLEGLSIAKPGQEMEANLITAFRELVVKLNETAFRPLFRRLYDWAFAGDSVNLEHQVVFIHLYMGLQDYFKNLMNPYMSFLLTPFSNTLSSYASGAASDLDLWEATLSSLNRSLTNDDGGFWRDDKLRAISTGLIQQIDVCLKHQWTDGKTLLKETLVSLVEGANDDSLLKAINLNVLMHTRSEEASVRLFALTCSEALWQNHGNKLLGLVAETATFIAECSEDENDMVVKESFRLKDAVERIAGKIDGL